MNLLFLIAVIMSANEYNPAPVRIVALDYEMRYSSAVESSNKDIAQRIQDYRAQYGKT